jgi:hypothetical protein
MDIIASFFYRFALWIPYKPRTFIESGKSDDYLKIRI